MSEHDQKGPDAAEPALPPYVIENARSGRSKCKTCRRAIPKDALRIGFLIEGPFGEGYLWHHINCAAKRNFDRLEEAYSQQAWRHAKTPPAEIPKLEQLSELRDRAELERKERKRFPYGEISPSGRARCKQCDEVLEKGLLRVVLGRRVEFGRQVRVTAAMVHPACVREELLREDSITDETGFEPELRANSGDLSESQLTDLLDQV